VTQKDIAIQITSTYAKVTQTLHTQKWRKLYIRKSDA
jgi:hypothetical protein